MSDDLTISASKPDHPGMDFSLLREEGLRHIRELAGDIWTDHNIHDPGITLLEALCYALTDLSYRCSFPVEDLLSSDPGNHSGNSADFRFAHEVLPNRPVTINDFRKLLIDLPGIKNAWLERTDNKKLQVFYDQEKDELTFETTPNLINIRGLYQVWVELAEHPVLGDLNSNTMTIVLEISGKPFFAELDFPHMSLVDKDWQKPAVLDSIGVTMAGSSQDAYDFVAHTNVKINGKVVKEHFDLKIRIMAEKTQWAEMETEVRTAISDRIQETGATSLFAQFNLKIIAITESIRMVEEELHLNRNLCEDFLNIDVIRIQDIAVECELEIPLDVSAEDLIAAICLDIHCFIDPPIRFYSLKEMLKECSPEEIFEGPLLKNGFIKDTNLLPFKSRDGIFTSDLVHLIMDTDGGRVKAIKGLKVSNYIDSLVICSGVANCLKLFEPSIYKPKLDVRRSAIRCKKNGIEVAIDKEMVIAKFKGLIKASEPDKSTPAIVNLSTPVGKDRKTGNYFSIQEHLPLTYGTGSAGLPEEAGTERRGQARQLKGYLLLYDQLLANFLAQLSNLKNLFSIDPTVGQTYFEQALYDSPDSMYLLKEFIGPQTSVNDKAVLKAAYDLFKASPANAYVAALRIMNEDQETFLDRRNRFLDHLLARFCEEFTDYSLLMVAHNNQEITTDLISRKVTFLQEYPVLGSERGVGLIINGPGAEPWNTENVPGLKKRIARLLGHSDFSRRSLTSPAFRFIEFYQEKDLDAIDEYRFRIFDDHKLIILSSPKAYRILEEGLKVLYGVLSFGLATGNYNILPSIDGRFYFNVLNDKNQILARRIDLFDSEILAQDEISRVAAFLNDQFNGISFIPEEGFHVIEHLLLRPRTHEGTGASKIHDPLWPVIPDDFGNPVQEGRNPYSFRITVVFPAECKTLSDRHFKELTERITRLETPAHVMPHIWFLDNVQLCHVELAWKAWLELSVLPVPEGATARRQHLKSLRNALKDLRSAMQFIPLNPQT